MLAQRCGHIISICSGVDQHEQIDAHRDLSNAMAFDDEAAAAGAS